MREAFVRVSAHVRMNVLSPCMHQCISVPLPLRRYFLSFFFFFSFILVPLPLWRYFLSFFNFFNSVPLAL